MIAMTALLEKYSGAGPLERGITRRRPEYEDCRTNGFIPGPPRRL